MTPTTVAGMPLTRTWRPINVRIAAVAGLPEPPAEDHDALGLRRVLADAETAAQDGPDPQQVEGVGADVGPLDPLRGGCRRSGWRFAV